jgi:hypothetical protein
VADNFSEGSWENYRNNFFASMVPPKKEYASFGLPTVEEAPSPVPSPRFGPMSGKGGSRRRTDSHASGTAQGAALSRRSSSYSEAVVAGPPPKVDESLIPEVVTIKVPVTTPIVKPIETRNYVSTTAYTIGNFSALDVGEEVLAEPVVNTMTNAVANAVTNAVANAVTNAVANAVTNAVANAVANPVTKSVSQPVRQSYDTVKVIFPEEKGEKEEKAREEKKDEVPSVKKYVPPSSNVLAQAQQLPKDPTSTTLIGAPIVHAIHYDGDAPIKPEENMFGEKRLVSFDFVIGDNIQYIEGKLFYFPRQVVTLQCAPFVHTHDTDFMKDSP